MMHVLDLKKTARLFFSLLSISLLFTTCQVDLTEEESEQLTADAALKIPGSGSISFKQAGPVGGGFPNVVTWDPNVPGKIYFGSDIGGTGRSTNYGKSFESAARGLGYEESHGKIATLHAVDVEGSTVLVGGTGFRGVAGEVISSTDGGEFWNHDSSDISFSAQNSGVPLPTGRPRSTDASLIQWVSGSTWVAGTYKDGVWISHNDRQSWTKLNVFDGSVFIRSMAMSPIDANTVYVGLWGDDSSIDNKGLWKISDLDGTPSATQVSGIPDVVESIVVLKSRLYLACGRFGVRRYVPANGNLNDITGPIGTSVMATAIHGFGRTWNTDRIVVGTAEGNGDIWMSEDSGTTWSNTTSSGVAIDAWGSDKNLLVFERHGNWVLGQSKCDVASIQVSPHDPDAWVVCSTSAIWTTDNAGATWKPANGYQILTFRDVAISRTETIAAGNVDHDVLISTSGGKSWDAIGLNGVTVGHAVAFSPNGEELAFGNGERDNNTMDGKLVVANSPHSPLVPGLTDIGNPVDPKRVVGLTWVTFPGGTERIIAAIDGAGMYTVDRPNTVWANWQPRSTALMGPQDNRGLRTSVVSNGAETSFVYDRATGVWRTANYGVNWEQILVAPAGEDQGYLAYDVKRNILYISTPTQVLRINDASKSEITNTLDFPTNNPGALCLDPGGRLLVFAKPQNASNSDCALFRNKEPEADTNIWIDIADPVLLRVSPQVIDLDASEYSIVLVTSGKGMLVSRNDAF